MTRSCLVTFWLIHKKVARLGPLVGFWLACSCLAYSVTFAAGLTELSEESKWVASDASIDEGFGWSAAISGNLAVIGANDGNALSGAGVYIFDVESGQEQFKWFPNIVATPSALGFSVDIQGSTAIAGAPGVDRPVGANFGSAFLFDTETGQQIHELTASDGASDDLFGRSVAIDGGLAVVGADRHDLPGFNSAGKVYVYDVQSGAELQKLIMPGLLEPRRLGRAVDISEGKVIAGATSANGTPLTPAGAAYVFDALTGQLLHRLTPSDGAADDDFGRSVAISGNRAIVGASGQSASGTAAGAAYVFDLTNGNEIFKLTPTDAMDFDEFGRSVDLRGNLAVVGASQGTGAVRQGAAYVFDLSDGTQLAKLTASDVTNGGNLGSSVAIGDEVILVGASRNQDDTGAVYAFKVVPEPGAFALLLFGLAISTQIKMFRRGPLLAR